MSHNEVPPPRKGTASWLIVGLCWLVVVFDGYDLIVYGTVLPELLDDPNWDVAPGLAGLLGSAAFAGMMVGALTAGALSDRLGRRKAVLLCTGWFSLFTVLCAFAWNPASFGTLRVLAGLGLGGLIPSVNALAAECVAPQRRSMVATVMMSGVPLGGSAAAFLGKRMIPAFGWQSMFLVAALGLVVVLPLCWWFLPETSHHARQVEGEAGAGGLFTRQYALASTLFALGTLGMLFTWYGLGTWLPELMRSTGAELGSSLSFVLALNLGAVAGSPITAWAGSRFGAARSAACAALVAGASLAGLLAGPSSAGTYALLVIAGVGTHGGQCLLLAGIAGHYPVQLRGTALGWAFGAGRIGAIAAPQVGGLLLAAGLGVGANFLAFAIAAVFAGVLLWSVPRSRAAASQAVPAHT